MLSLWGTDWILKYYLDELRLQVVKQWPMSKNIGANKSIPLATPVRVDKCVRVCVCVRKRADCKALRSCTMLMTSLVLICAYSFVLRDVHIHVDGVRQCLWTAVTKGPTAHPCLSHGTAFARCQKPFRSHSGGTSISWKSDSDKIL
jgi:hypothetical protein